MEKLSPCPNCESRALYRSEEVRAAGSHGPNLLPWLGGLFRWGRMKVVLCRDCGLMRFFASAEARAKVAESKKWTPL